MSDIVNNLKKLCDEHEKQLIDIRQKIATIDLIPKAKALVGKCFKYPNSYSGFFGFGRSGQIKRKGYIYKRVTGCDKEYIIVNTFFMEHPGKIEITFGEKQYVTSFPNSTLIQITEKQYFTAFNKLVKYVFERGKKEK